jgi:hypothetical protein
LIFEASRYIDGHRHCRSIVCGALWCDSEQTNRDRLVELDNAVGLHNAAAEHRRELSGRRGLRLDQKVGDIAMDFQLSNCHWRIVGVGAQRDVENWLVCGGHFPTFVLWTNVGRS